MREPQIALFELLIISSWTRLPSGKLKNLLKFWAFDLSLNFRFREFKYRVLVGSQTPVQSTFCKLFNWILLETTENPPRPGVLKKFFHSLQGKVCMAKKPPQLEVVATKATVRSAGSVVFRSANPWMQVQDCMPMWACSSNPWGILGTACAQLFDHCSRKADQSIFKSIEICSYLIWFIILNSIMFHRLGGHLFLLLSPVSECASP